MDESEHSEQLSKNVGGNTNKESEKDTAEATENKTEQASTKKQVEIVSTSTQSGKSPIIGLKHEREKFKKKLHIDTNPKQTSKI